MTRYKLFRYFYDKKTEHFCWEIVKFVQFSRAIYLNFISDPELPGSRMIFSRIYIRIPLKSFGTDQIRIRIRIHNTEMQGTPIPRRGVTSVPGEVSHLIQEMHGIYHMARSDISYLERCGSISGVAGSRLLLCREAHTFSRRLQALLSVLLPPVRIR